MVTAQIVTIGDEIIIGQIVDTNSVFIAQQLENIGVTVSEIHSIRDSKDKIIQILDKALDNNNIVIVTGGLGPTKDDITKHALAQMFDSQLVRDEETYLHVKNMMVTKGIVFNELNQSQADVPACCTVIKNESGSAPAMMFQRNRNLMFSLPGVPFEMKHIIENNVVPIIKSKFTLSNNTHKTVLVYGLPESILSEKIEKWETALPDNFKLAYLPNAKGVRLRISAYDVEQNLANDLIEKCFDDLQKLIPENFLGYEPATLQASVAQLLVQSNATLSLAESCTGGALAAKFTAMPGASDYFTTSVVAYANQVKTYVLAVPQELINEKGAVSTEVAESMAVGVRKLSGSDFAIAVTGIAGPTGATLEKQVGTVCFAVAGEGFLHSEQVIFSNSREYNIEKSCSHAINLLRRIILKNHCF